MRRARTAPVKDFPLNVQYLYGDAGKSSHFRKLKEERINIFKVLFPGTEEVISRNNPTPMKTEHSE